MNKAERNERIVAGLRAHGVMVHAARDAGVSTGTVKRLIEANEDASVAFTEGFADLLLRRIARHATKADEAEKLWRKAIVETVEAKQKLLKEFVDLDHVALRERDKEVEALDTAERALAAKVSACRKTHKRASSRAELLYGVTSVVGLPEKKNDR